MKAEERHCLGRKQARGQTWGMREESKVEGGQGSELEYNDTYEIQQ